MSQSADEMHSRSSSFCAQLDMLFVLYFILISFQQKCMTQVICTS